MFSTRKISMFFVGISAVSMSLFTVSFPTTSAGDNWPWGVPSQQSVAAGQPSVADIPAEDDNWPWGRSANGVSGAATLA